MLVGGPCPAGRATALKDCRVDAVNSVITFPDQNEVSYRQQKARAIGSTGIGQPSEVAIFCVISMALFQAREQEQIRLPPMALW